MSFVHSCVSFEQTLLARYLAYLLTEFDQTFTSNGLWGKDRQLNFGVKRSRVKVIVAISMLLEA